jgi:ribosomal protein S18 acetylase RimI-like enzyme
LDKIEIKQASLEDADMILQLQIQAYLTEAEIYNDYSIPPLIQSFNEIKQEFSQQIFLKAIKKGEEEDEEGGDQTMTIVGSVRAYHERGTAYIRRLIVKPEYQNKGVGTKLMQAIEQHFKFANRYELFTGHKSTRNLHLYQKLGYYEFKRVPVNESLTMVFLEKYNNHNNKQQRKWFLDDRRLLS